MKQETGEKLRYVVGVDIGGTKCAVVLAQTDDACMPTILKKQSVETDFSHGCRWMIGQIHVMIDEIIAEYHIDVTSQMTGIGISCGGPLDTESGVILSPPNLPGWDEVPLTSLIRERYPIPVALENDANACAVAEHKFGAGRGFQHLVFLTFGTGLGAGLILNGQLYRGANSMAGEAGHIRLSEHGPVGYGKAGSFEGFCSGGGIAQLARIKLTERWQRGERPTWCPDESFIDRVDAKLIAQEAKKNDLLALEIFSESGRMLGRGLSILIDFLNPERIIIGSIFQRSGELLWPHAEAVIHQECLVASANACQVVPSALGDSLGDYAAISLVV